MRIHSFLILLSLLGLVSCQETFNFKTPKIVDEFLKLRFSKFITNSSSISCGISYSGKLYCNKDYDVSGTSFFEFSIPSKWAVKNIDAGRAHMCGIFSGPIYDEVWCRGTGTSGQLGDGNSENSDQLVKVSGLPALRLLDLGLGNTRSCVTTSDRKVYCWGAGGFGTGVSSVESAVAINTNLNGFVELKQNYSGSCGLKEDKSLWCWGPGSNGVLGQGNTTHHYSPVQVKKTAAVGDYLIDVSEFAVGQNHTCAIANEEVYCWGISARVGIDAAGNTTLPRHLPELSGAVKIEAGDYHTCALLKTNEVYCWGRNRNFQVGVLEDREIISPTKVDLGQNNIVDMALGNGNNPSIARSCALTDLGEIYCWGTAGFGVFGSIEPLLAHSFALQPEQNVSGIEIADSQSCMVSDGRLYGAGYNDYSQFASDRYFIGAPVLISEDPVSSFDCNRYTNCYVSSGKMFCQGNTYTGQQEITSLGSTVVRPVSASHTSCGLMNNGDLYCWGSNGNGQVGNGSTTAVNVNSPFLTLTDVSQAVGGTNVLCAIKNDKTVWCWGNNSVGATGNPGSHVLVPTLVQGLPDLSSASYLKIKINAATTCLQADNDLYCWGGGIGKLLSLGTDYSFLPVKVNTLGPSIKKFAIISGGLCASYTDSSVSCITSGEDSLGVLSKGTAVKKNFPALPTEISDLEGGIHLLCAVLVNGERHCLGNNSTGGMSHIGIAPPLILNPVKWMK